MNTPQDFTSDLPPGVRAIVGELSRFNVDPEHLDLQRISDLIETLFQEIGSEDIGSVIEHAVSHGLLSQAQGNKVIDVAMWCGQTNGRHLSATIERWLEEGASTTKIELALAQGTFPFSTQAKMADVLTEIAKRHPHFAPTIDAMIERRRAQGV